MRHLLPSQYTRVSITAEDLLDLVEKVRERRLHQWPWWILALDGIKSATWQY